MTDFCACGELIDDHPTLACGFAHRVKYAPRHLRIGYPAASHVWEPIASPAERITGSEVLKWSKAHFDVTGDGHVYYLTARDLIGTSRRVLDDETMADLPRVDGVVELRLVREL